MAWVAEETFESYSNGDNISGKNGGTGFASGWAISGTPTGTWAVSNVSPAQGSLHVVRNGGENSDMRRQLAVDVSGSFVFYIALRMGSFTGSTCSFNIRDTSDNATVGLAFTTSGTITWNGVTLFASYTADTYYFYRITANGTSFTVARSTDAFGSVGTWSAESSSANYLNGTTIRHMLVGGNGSNGNRAIDYISPTSPFITPTGTTGRLMMMGMGR